MKDFKKNYNLININMHINCSHKSLIYIDFEHLPTSISDLTVANLILTEEPLNIKYSIYPYKIHCVNLHI